MKIMIKPLLDGAKSAEGTAVIIDVINASSTIVECLDMGAKEIVPVKTMKEAVETKKSGDLICGEMANIKIKPDFYNSVDSASKSNVKGKRIIINTAAGTRGILGAVKADETIIGCFLNVSAIVNYIKNKKPRTVTLVPMGDYGKTKNVEDDIFACYLRDLLENRTPEDFNKIKARIKRGSLRNIFRSILIKNNINSALKLNTSKIVPKFDGGKIVSYG